MIKYKKHKNQVSIIKNIQKSKKSPKHHPLLSRNTAFSKRTQSVFEQRSKLAESKNDQIQLEAMNIYYSNVANKINMNEAIRDLNLDKLGSGEEQRFNQINNLIGDKKYGVISQRSEYKIQSPGDFRKDRCSYQNSDNHSYFIVNRKQKSNKHSKSSVKYFKSRSRSTMIKNRNSTNVSFSEFPMQKLLKRSKYDRHRNKFKNSRRDHPYLPGLS
mmetsp:Transcript_7482/g.6627  ORF Transcript_7482/g.6627 Transcript_7482/m.6627 type:complete len:215 (-) Transcript_7482:42-686(-)